GNGDAVGLWFWLAVLPGALELSLVDVGAPGPFTGRGWVGEDCRACLFVVHPLGAAVEHEAKAVAAGGLVARLDSFAEIFSCKVGKIGSNSEGIGACSRWKRIEGIARIIEPQQLGWALRAALLALLFVGKIGRARQAQDAIDVLRARFGAKPQHDGG